MMKLRVPALGAVLLFASIEAFVTTRDVTVHRGIALFQQPSSSPLSSKVKEQIPSRHRRELLTAGILAPFAAASPVLAASFTPGGTMVDYEVGVMMGNDQASPSRSVDNSNVLFNQDFYYKFGTAPPWMSSPQTMPFTPNQQR
jgi:hypothetical protein